jgi:hypothetical protein
VAHPRVISRVRHSHRQVCFRVARYYPLPTFFASFHSHCGNPLRASPQTTQSTIFISHLTNSNGCGNLTPGSANVSPLGTLLLPQPSVYSQLRVAIQPNFYASGASSFLSLTCRLLVSLCALFRARVVCFQQLADSFCKIPGVGYPECFYGMPGVGMPLASRPPLPLPTLRSLCLCGESGA